ncbi:MAG: peptidoglycan D,D-transpeptidase FtsI family protein [Asticcacaulis sp.]
MKVGLPLTQSGFQWVADRVWKVEHAFERANATGEKSSSARMRIFSILVGLSFAYIFLAIFASRASLSGGANAQIAALTGETNARAQLVDRTGALLATDVNDYNVFVDPGDMTASDRESVKDDLIQALPPSSRDAIDRAFRLNSRTLVATMLRQADHDRILNYGLPGVSFEAQRVRDYPLGTTAAFYIGMTKRAGEGMSGAELALQDQITAASAHDEPVALAMDLRVQGALENEMRNMAVAQGAKGAVGIVTNVRTGEVLALASWPEFDLANPGAYDDNSRRNRAAVDRFEVGSIFKVISIAIGLDTGTATLDSQYDGRQPLQLGSRLIHDDEKTGQLMTLQDVFIKSSNIGTSHVALNAGAANMTRYYQALNLFKPAQTELKEPAPPIIPRRWSDSELVSSAFGQAMAITPLSYAQAAGAVLNGGYLRPLTIKKYDGTSPLAGTRVFSPQTSRTMLDLMRANVLKGTGTRANAPGLRVGGKTGTAQKAVGGHYTADRVSSFAAVFPTDGAVDSDRYLVLVTFDSPNGSVESNGSKMGGFVAAPVAGRVIDRIAPFLNVERKDDKFTSPQWDKAPVQAEDTTGDEH